jgi:hypothetical protein
MTYCPTSEVRRDQMAAFLNRGLGRGAFGEEAAVDLTASGLYVAQTSITVLGAGWVHVTADGMAYTTDLGNGATGCPCEVDLQVYAPELDAISYFFAETLYNAILDQPSYVHLGTNNAFSVAAAGTYTFKVWMARPSGTAPVKADATVTALWVPFGATGGANFGGSPTVAKDRQGH